MRTALDPRMTKLAPDFNFPKILTVIGSFCVSARNDRETALFSEKKNGYEVIPIFVSRASVALCVTSIPITISEL